jgi:HPt (histidine-containing phosphotransfer) domain-containing protein
MTDTCGLIIMDAVRTIPRGQPIRDQSNTEVLDLQGLCDRCLGNLELVQRVLGRFEQRLPEELDELQRELALGDAAKVALIAHRIRGSASNVSAAGLQKAAAEIEDSSRAGRMTDAYSNLRRLREQWQRYVDCRPALQPMPDNCIGQNHMPIQAAFQASEAIS